MTRADLKEMIDSWSSSQISAEMIADPLVRSIERVRDRAINGYRDSLRALYADRALTDDQRRDGVQKARARRDVALKKLRRMEERYEREVRIPLLKRLGVLRDLPAKSGKHRA